jgi:hypothetical protein
MKFQIDTENKTIKVLEDVNLKKMVSFLKDLLKEDYEKYSFISTDVYTYTSYPIVVQPYQYPYTYTKTGDITWFTTSGSAVYNIELQEHN